jgi:hypothetical protein
MIDSLIIDFLNKFFFFKYLRPFISRSGERTLVSESATRYKRTIGTSERERVEIRSHAVETSDDREGGANICLEEWERVFVLRKQRLI